MKKASYLLCLCWLFILLGCQAKVPEAKKLNQENVSQEVASEEEAVDYDEELWYAQSDPDIYEKPREFVFAKTPRPKKELRELGYQSDELVSRIEETMWAFERYASERATDVYESAGLSEVKVSAFYRPDGDKLVLIEGEVTPEEDAIMRREYQLFVRLVPEAYRQNISKVEVVSHHFFGAVIKYDKDNDGKQVLAINPQMMGDVAGSQTLNTFASLRLYVHELAHLFAMDPNQTLYGEYTFDPLGSTFDRFKKNSYMNLFYEYFWQNVSKHYKDNIYKKPEDVDTFYELNRDKFVSKYAVTNPYADFAGSFLVFVMRYTPSEDEEYPLMFEKVNFFYQYKELVELRAELLQNMVAILENP